MLNLSKVKDKYPKGRVVGILPGGVRSGKKVATAGTYAQYMGKSLEEQASMVLDAGVDKVVVLLAVPGKEIPLELTYDIEDIMTPIPSINDLSSKYLLVITTQGMIPLKCKGSYLAFEDLKTQVIDLYPGALISSICAIPYATYKSFKQADEAE